MPRVAIGEAIARRADVDVLVGDVAKILLAEPACGFGAGGRGLRQGDGDARLVAGQNLGAVEVAPIGDDIELIGTEDVLGPLRHVGQL